MKYFMVFVVILAMLLNTGCMSIEGRNGKDGQEVQQGKNGQDGNDGQDAGASYAEGSDITSDGTEGSHNGGDSDGAGVEAGLAGNEPEDDTSGASGAEGSGNGNNLEINPIVAQAYLLGGYSEDGGWVTAEDLADQIKGGETYSCYAFDKMVGTGTGHSVELLEPCDAISVSVSCENDYLVAVGGEWNALPRIPVSQGTGSETYKKIIRDVLAENGLPDTEAVIKQNFRIDLEGDGVDEVLIWASNLDYDNIDIAAQKGQYSIIMLRKIIDGEVKNIPVSYVIYTEDTNKDNEDIDEDSGDYNYSITYVDKIRSIADVNGDGIMEVIIDSRYYEGEFVVVYELQGDKMVDVISNGWGV